jgi:urease accessory protein
VRDLTADHRARTRAAGVFAANRARGSIALVARFTRGITQPRSVAEEGSLRVRFPGARARLLEAVTVNTAGGIAGGDHFDVTVAVEEGARLSVTTTAAEKVYRTLGAPATIDLRLSVSAGAMLLWLPQETILFDRAGLRRSIEVDVAEGGGLVLAEAIVFGRTAMGEAVEHGSLFDRWRVRHGGRLRFVETVRLDGAVAERLRQPAVAAGAVAIATILMLPGDEAALGAIRAAAVRSEVAASAWNGLAVVRLVAKDAMWLRADLVSVLTAMGEPLPHSCIH